jgi:predicted fused transcriptional regulator/phosphomethylpyrimidine kinase
MDASSGRVFGYIVARGGGGKEELVALLGQSVLDVSRLRRLAEKAPRFWDRGLSGTFFSSSF